MPAELAPPPTIDPAAPMIVRTERILIERPPRTLHDWMSSTPLEDSLPATSRLPGVVGTTLLTKSWGEPGARRIVHLSDGAQATEQILDQEPGRRFRYVVWDYTTPAARPVAYAIGEFRFLAAEGERTELVWTYAFRLRGDRFPGVLGPLGRWLMRVAFLDRAYAELMRETLKRTKAGAEA